MHSGGKRKASGTADVSVVPADGAMGPPPTEELCRSVSCGDVRSSDDGKRFKPGSPLGEKSVQETTDMETDCTVGGGVKNPSLKKKKKKNGKGATNVAEVKPEPAGVEPEPAEVKPEAAEVKKMKALHDLLRAKLSESTASKEDCLAILEIWRGCEEVAHGLLREVSGLKEFIRGSQSSGNVRRSAPAVSCVTAPAVAAGATGVPAAVVADAFPPLVKKPTETWSVVVFGKGKAVPSEEIIRKVKNEVGPTMSDVRVHDLKPIRGGGAVLKTRSKAEREKIAGNKKFEELGLEVAVGDKLGPRIVVKAVEAGITPEEFMNQLFEKNFSECMDDNIFKKKVRMVTRPWEAGDGKIDVVLEGSQDAMQHLLDVGRVYINWFGFLVRPQGEVAHCYRCLGFDHLRRNCRVKESVCRICSKEGHEARQCKNSPYCRNCALRGLPAGHTLLSPVCPIYAGLVARANARH